MKVSTDLETISTLLAPKNTSEERLDKIQKRIEEIDKEIKALRSNNSINPKQKTRMISLLYMEKLALEDELRRGKDASRKKDNKVVHPHARPLKERKVAEDPNKPIAINFKI